MIRYIQYHNQINNKRSAKKCLQLEMKLQKSEIVISKLQKRCADKTSEIKRLRLSEKRSKLAEKTLEDLIHEMKEKNWISEEGRDVLNVIDPNISHCLNKLLNVSCYVIRFYD